MLLDLFRRLHLAYLFIFFFFWYPNFYLFPPLINTFVISVVSMFLLLTNVTSFPHFPRKYRYQVLILSHTM